MRKRIPPGQELPGRWRRAIASTDSSLWESSILPLRQLEGGEVNRLAALDRARDLEAVLAAELLLEVPHRVRLGLVGIHERVGRAAPGDERRLVAREAH